MTQDHSTILGNFYTYMRARELAQTTSVAYVQDIRQFLRFITIHDINLTNLTEKHVQLFIEQCKQKFSAASIQRKIGSLRLFWRFRGRIPTTTLTENFTRPEQKTITDEQLLAYITKVQKEHSSFLDLRTITLLILLLRVKVPAAQLAQVYKNTITVKSRTLQLQLTKGQKITAILAPALLEMVQKYLVTCEHSIYLFEATPGTPMTPHAMRALPKQFLRIVQNNDNASMQTYVQTESAPAPEIYSKHIYDQLHPRR